MAYTPCNAAITANIQIDCARPLAGGYTGRALLIPLSPAPTFTYNGSNAQIIEAVTMAGASKMVAVENFSEQPFSGTGSASNAEGAVMRHTKTFQFDIPKRGAEVSKNIVDPLTRLPLGFAIIAEKQDKTYEFIGAERGLRVNADGVTSDAYTRDGATQIVASCSQYNYEYEFLDTDAATTQTKFETYLAATL